MRSSATSTLYLPTVLRVQDLAVQVGQADLVVINQVQRANAAACQCFHRIASNTANAKHGHTGVYRRSIASLPNNNCVLEN